MKYKLLIFDMDGTILDTLEDLKNSCNYALEINNMPTRTLAEVRAFVGNGLGRLVAQAVPEGTCEEMKEKVLDDLKKHYGVHCNDTTKPYEGIIELMKKLKQQGYKLAVVSNKIDSAVTELCQLHFQGIFDFSLGEKSGLARKPAPDMVWKCCEFFGVSKEESIYIGDSEVDFMTAKNSGLECIAVSWGFRDLDVAESYGMEKIANMPEDIITFL